MLVSVLAHPTRQVLTAAGVSEEDLEQAVRAQVLEADGNESIRFTHPLLASAAYQRQTVRERRHTHARLASVVADPIARARHLALASAGADSVTAAVLDDAAREASARGVALVAAELAEFALRLTPTSAYDDHCRRAITAARAHLVAGDADLAEGLVRRLLASSGLPDFVRAQALVLLSDVEGRPGEVARAMERLREAVTSTEEPALQCSVHARLARFLRITEGPAAAERHAQAALELAEQLEDDALRARALATVAVVHLLAAEPDALALAERAHRLEPAADRVWEVDWEWQPSLSLAYVLLWSGQHERARPLLENLERELSQWNELMGAGVLTALSIAEFRAGRLSVAADYAERASAIFSEYGVDAEGSR
jgi:tetratricopeptide (TPR) repeat protein